MRQSSGRPRRTLRERLYQFMIGRNGPDALGNALMILYLVLFVANLITAYLVKPPYVTYVTYGFYLLECALIVYSVFRMFSRNLYARRRENAWHLRRVGAIKGFFKLQKNKRRDRKTHVYRKCKACKSVLRLPREKGKHTVRCPKCQHRFEVKI